MEAKSSLPHSQAPTTCPCTQINPVHASSHFLKIYFNIILPSTPRSFERSHAFCSRKQNYTPQWTPLWRSTVCSCGPHDLRPGHVTCEQPRTYIAFQVKFPHFFFLPIGTTVRIFIATLSVTQNVKIPSNGNRDTVEKLCYSASKVHLCIERSQRNLLRS